MASVVFMQTCKHTDMHACVHTKKYLASPTWPAQREIIRNSIWVNDRFTHSLTRTYTKMTRTRLIITAIFINKHLLSVCPQPAHILTPWHLPHQTYLDRTLVRSGNWLRLEVWLQLAPKHLLSKSIQILRASNTAHTHESSHTNIDNKNTSL